MKISQANLPLTSSGKPRINALGGGCTASGSGGGAWFSKHCSWQCRTCPVAMPSLHWQRRLIAEFGVLPSGSCANKNCCHRSSVYITLKKISTKQTHGFFVGNVFGTTKTPANHWVQVAFGAGAGQLGAVLHIQLQWQIHHCPPHHADLELSSIPALRLALQLFYNSKKIVQNEFPWKELFQWGSKLFGSPGKIWSPNHGCKWLKENLHPPPEVWRNENQVWPRVRFDLKSGDGEFSFDTVDSIWVLTKSHFAEFKMSALRFLKKKKNRYV